MKKILLFIHVIALSVVAISQPLTNNSLPAIGSSYQFNQVTGTIVHPGAGGANQTWNFQALANSGLLVYEVIPQSSLTATDISTFPTANYFIQSYYSGSPLGINFKEVQSTRLLYHGQKGSGGNYTVYSPPEVDYEFGMTLGSVITYQINGGNTTRTTTYDAYGTLTTPYGTFNDVIRLKTSEAGFGATTDTLFCYYATTPVMRPLLQYVVTTAGQTDNKFVYNYTTLVSSGQGIDDYGSQVRIYPNPSINEMYVEGPKDNLELFVFNSAGQEVLNGSVNAGTNRVDISSLAKGVYFVRLISSSGINIIRLMKE